MNDQDKSREDLIEELAVLRQDYEEICNREKRHLIPDAIAESELYKTLVSDVPEYIYSIEFNKGKITPTFHSPRCEEITGYPPSEYAKNPNLWMEMIYEKDRERVENFI